VREQIEILLDNFPVAAIKTGLLCSGKIISVIAQALHHHRDIPLVIDPVMIATSGRQLLDPGAVKLYEKELFPLATLITPNLDEASKLLGESVKDRPSMKRAVQSLGQKYGIPVLLKGGHLSGGAAVDLLWHDGKTAEFKAPFIRNLATHG